MVGVQAVVAAVRGRDVRVGEVGRGVERGWRGLGGGASYIPSTITRS